MNPVSPHSYTAKQHTAASLADMLERDYFPQPGVGGKKLYLCEHEWRLVIDALRSCGPNDGLFLQEYMRGGADAAKHVEKLDCAHGCGVGHEVATKIRAFFNPTMESDAPAKCSKKIVGNDPGCGSTQCEWPGCLQSERTYATGSEQEKA